MRAKKAKRRIILNVVLCIGYAKGYENWKRESRQVGSGRRRFDEQLSTKPKPSHRREPTRLLFNDESSGFFSSVTCYGLIRLSYEKE